MDRELFLPRIISENFLYFWAAITISTLNLGKPIKSFDEFNYQNPRELRRRPIIAIALLIE